MSAHPRGIDLNPDSVDALPEIRVHPGEGWIAVRDRPDSARPWAKVVPGVSLSDGDVADWLPYDVTVCCAFCPPDVHDSDEPRHTHGEACCQHIPPGHTVREDPEYGELTVPLSRRDDEREVRTEWGYRWTRPDGTSFVRGCLDEDDARETVEAWPGRAEVVAREIRVGPWTAAETGGDASGEHQGGQA